MKCLFIGNPVPQDFILKVTRQNFSHADNIAQNAMISSLASKYGNDLVVLTVAANYRDPMRVRRGHRGQLVRLDGGVKAYGVGNLDMGKPMLYISLLFTYTFALFRVVRHWSKSESGPFLIVSSGCYLPTALPICLVKLFHNICYVPFLIGSVELPDYRGILAMVSKMGKVLLVYADATITYVARSAIDYTDKPYLEIIYTLPDAVIDSTGRRPGREPSDRQRPMVVYTGALTRIKGARLLLDTIERAGSAYHWVICGTGEYAADFERAAQRHPDYVDYLGVVDHHRVVALQEQADVLIALQSLENDIYRYYARYAATGKLTEYLLAGTPILTMDIDAISNQIHGFLNFIDQPTPEAVIDGLEAVLSDPNGEVVRKAEAGEAYVREHASVSYQSHRITQFLDQVVGRWTSTRDGES